MKSQNPVAKLVERHLDTVTSCITKAKHENALGKISRIFNETTIRDKSLTTSMSFIDAAAHTPPIDPNLRDEDRGQQALDSIASLPELNLWYKQLKHQAATTLFDQHGKLKNSILGQLQPAIDSAYSHFGEDKVNHQILVSYCLSFVFAQSVEANAMAYLPSYDADEMPIAPGALNAQQQITQALNFEAHQTGALATTCKAAHAEETNKLLRKLEYAQVCAQTAHKNAQRFLLASRALNIAITEQLPADYSVDDIGNAYEALVKKGKKVDLCPQAAKKISELHRGLTDYACTANNHDQAKQQLEAVQATYATSIFLIDATTSQPALSAKADHKNINRYLTKVTSGNLYKEWCADSRLGMLHIRRLERVYSIDRQAIRVSKLESRGANEEALLAQYLNLKSVTDAWVEIKKEKYKDGIYGPSRLPAGLKLQIHINKKIAQLAAAVHSPALQSLDTKEANAQQRCNEIKRAKTKHGKQLTKLHPMLLEQVAKRTQYQQHKEQVREQHRLVMSELPSHRHFHQPKARKPVSILFCIHALMKKTQNNAESARKAFGLFLKAAIQQTSKKAATKGAQNLTELRI